MVDRPQRSPGQPPATGGDEDSILQVAQPAGSSWSGPAIAFPPLEPCHTDKKRFNRWYVHCGPTRINRATHLLDTAQPGSKWRRRESKTSKMHRHFEGLHTAPALSTLPVRSGWPELVLVGSAWATSGQRGRAP